MPQPHNSKSQVDPLLADSGESPVLPSRRIFLAAAPLALAGLGCGGERVTPRPIMDRRTPEEHIAYRVRQPGMGIEIDFQFSKPGYYYVQAFMSHRARVSIGEWKTISPGEALPAEPPRGAGYVQVVSAMSGSIAAATASLPASDERWQEFLRESERVRGLHPAEYQTFSAGGSIITCIARLEAFVPTPTGGTPKGSTAPARDDAIEVMRCQTMPSLVRIHFVPAGTTNLRGDVVPLDFMMRFPSGVR